jgi:DNA replication protein DnaC
MDRVSESQISTLLPKPGDMPDSLSEPISPLEEKRLARVKACRAICGLTEAEWEVSETEMIVDDNNRAIHSALTLVACDQNKNVLVSGPTGRGKTRLALTCVHEAVQNGVYVKFWPMNIYVMDLRREAMANSDESSAIRSTLAPKVLVLDDFGASKITDWYLMAVETAFDEWYRNRRTGMVVTTNLTVDQIAATISDRIANRIAETFKVFELRGKDWRLAA